MNQYSWIRKGTRFGRIDLRGVAGYLSRQEQTRFFGLLILTGFLVQNFRVNPCGFFHHVPLDKFNLTLVLLVGSECSDILQ